MSFINWKLFGSVASYRVPYFNTDKQIEIALQKEKNTFQINLYQKLIIQGIRLKRYRLIQKEKINSAYENQLKAHPDCFTLLNGNLDLNKEISLKDIEIKLNFIENKLDRILENL